MFTPKGCVSTRFAVKTSPIQGFYRNKPDFWEVYQWRKRRLKPWKPPPTSWCFSLLTVGDLSRAKLTELWFGFSPSATTIRISLLIASLTQVENLIASNVDRKFAVFEFFSVWFWICDEGKLRFIENLPKSKLLIISVNFCYLSFPDSCLIWILSQVFDSLILVPFVFFFLVFDDWFCFQLVKKMAAMNF